MASAELHIKDSYYFEVPKFLLPSHHREKADFESVWVKNDPDFQQWELERLCAELNALEKSSPFGLPPVAELQSEYRHWKESDHTHFGKPFDVYLAEGRAALCGEYKTWKGKPENANSTTVFTDWLSGPELVSNKFEWFARQSEDPAWAKSWAAACERAGGREAVAAYKADSTIIWSPAKVDAYNKQLSGKIIIPQPFGELKNLYERESGFCISRFMVIEGIVFVGLLLVFSWLGRKVVTGAAPRGRLWNMLEAVVLFLRDEVARPAIGGDEHHDAHQPHGQVDHGHGKARHGHPADDYVPLLATLFFFILSCNLMGMLPWFGTPTASLSTTLALACVTFATVILCGSAKFGVLGFWKNQIPHMELPLVLAILLKPPIFLIEVLGLFIKHGVLALRLLANMVAGHLVLLAIMALAFSVEGALNPNWTFTAVIAVIASTALSCLELFVAFLQAYVFTLLSALFIGAATSHH